MSNVDDFLRYRSEARALFPMIAPFALIEQSGPEISWEHFNAGIPQYNVPPGFDVNENQRLALVGYHEPGHELDEYLSLKDPTKAHHEKFLRFIGIATPWDALKAAADALSTPQAQHAADPGEWWADAFANAVAGRVVVDDLHTSDALAMREFFLGLIGGGPLIEWAGPAATGNYFVGRSGNPIALIVDHWVGAGTLEQAIAHFKDGGAQVSAHYIVGTDGRIVQVVKDEDTAYHAGSWPVNQLSIGIEHEATPTLVPSEKLYEASAWLHRYLADKHGLDLIVGTTVKRHRDIIPTQCPGTLDVERIVSMAVQYVTKTEFEAYKLALEQQLIAQYASVGHTHPAPAPVPPAKHSHPATTTVANNP